MSNKNRHEDNDDAAKKRERIPLKEETTASDLSNEALDDEKAPPAGEDKDHDGKDDREQVQQKALADQANPTGAETEDKMKAQEKLTQEAVDDDSKKEPELDPKKKAELQVEAVDKPLSPSYVNTLQAVAELHPNASANTIRDVYQANQLTALATHTVLEMLGKLTEYGYVDRRMGKPAPDSDTPVEYFELTTSGRERLAIEREAMRK